jgi:hypothetical protein
MKIAYKDENSASGALVQLLRGSPVALRCFLSLCEVDLSRARPSLQIDHRHKTDEGREIDVLLHDGDFGIIVECKVEDVQKHYQFNVYQQYWRRTRKSEPKIVWLLKRTQNVLGNELRGATTITWNQLKDSLMMMGAGATAAEASLIRGFCDCMVEAEICLKPGAVPVKRKICRGYDQIHAHRILTTIRDGVPGLVGGVEELNELPPALHIGRPEWKRMVSDEWVDRLWFYLDPVMRSAGVPSPYFFSGVIYLANNGSGVGKIPSAQVARIPKWAAFLASKGFEVRKNCKGSWRRSEVLTPPYAVSLPLNYVTGKEMAPRPNFRLNEDDLAIMSGIPHLRKLVETVDQMVSLR